VAYVKTDPGYGKISVLTQSENSKIVPKETLLSHKKIEVLPIVFIRWIIAK